ncbi:Uncharacterised protein [Corynebacterium kutscheri]|uniref:Uncharacterized protein n=1 Tax=Corynebacterium kutscheri TaxID=35755 RepID=A0A0F6TDB2_9CORY|nr:hypothetical protein [Corynebacterium kutscheri]AKE41096.1 hypothetical protein UL82_04550 [Corynebacterium kutscheri]VEH07000.1 Uncharacterised protein [Corynebacterium kutscheri]VEH09411.1 Uncharacterised protein [Corynebacterium kutscheri]VEH79495.1 Uncharacterised protein [Corynebacterium kutscheri]
MTIKRPATVRRKFVLHQKGAVKVLEADIVVADTTEVVFHLTNIKEGRLDRRIPIQTNRH